MSLAAVDMLAEPIKTVSMHDGRQSMAMNRTRA